MIAEILATGDEIRSGALVDSNSAFIAQSLEGVGVEVMRHSCVGDDPGRMVEIFKEISGRADIAVVTGGLGPTGDDLTAVAVAKASGVELKIDSRALESVENFFRARNRPVSESNKKQALLPDGADCLENPIGTAPGFSFKIGRCLFFFLPGVPFEMRRMMAESVIPRIVCLPGAAKSVRLVRTISTFGLTESATGDSLVGFEDQFPGITIGFRASFPIIQVKLYGAGQDKEELLGRLETGADWVCQKLGHRVISTQGESLEKVVGDLLRMRKATLAVAESCTGGLISNLLTDVAGSSDYFVFSAVTYSNQAKMNVLHVAGEILESHGAVSEQTALEMARGVRHLSAATYAISTTGIAGPTGATTDKPVGTVCIGLATAESTRTRRYHFTYGNRRMNKLIFAAAALDLLRRTLLGLKPEKIK